MVGSRNTNMIDLLIFGNLDILKMYVVPNELFTAGTEENPTYPKTIYEKRRALHISCAVTRVRWNPNHLFGVTKPATRGRFSTSTGKMLLSLGSWTRVRRNLLVGKPSYGPIRELHDAERCLDELS
jgi:hypothetical protein